MQSSPRRQQCDVALGACRQDANLKLTVHVSAYQHALQLSDLVAGGIAAPRRKEGWLKVRHVPYIFAVHDCISDIASGMTVKCATSTHSPGASLRSAALWPFLTRQHLRTAAIIRMSAQAGCWSSSNAPGLMSLCDEIEHLTASVPSQIPTNMV